MELNEDSNFAASSMTFHGAIFMCNRATKRECMKRRLFGLPRPYMSFVEKIKSGMILFLFEYEERKLYGIYEATCNGSADIDRCAFTSSGKSFKAQIRFRIISSPPPLSENAFSYAIKDNYFTVKKFHFYLSREQVDKLIELFLARETSIRRSLSSGTAKKAKKQSREYVDTNIRVSFRNDNNIENDIGPANFSSHPSPYKPDLNCYGYYNKSILNTNDCVGNGEPLFWTTTHSSELQMNDPMPSTSRNDGTVKLHGSPHLDHPCYHGDLGFQLERSPLSLGVGNVHGSMEDITGYPKSVADSSILFSRGHLYLSHTDPDALESSSSDYLSLNVPTDYKLSTVPQEHEPSFLGSSLVSRYFGRAIDPTNLEGYEFHDRYEPYVSTLINRGFGMKRITEMSSPCNSGEDPLHSGEFCYSAAPPHGGSCENTQAWSTAAIPLSETKDLGRFVSPFHPSSNLESSYHDGCEGPSFHQPTHHEELTTVVSHMRSDTYNRKGSVFSRLSVNAEVNAENDDYNSITDSASSGFMRRVEMKSKWRHAMKRSMNMYYPGSHTEITTEADMKDANALDNEEKLEDINETEIPFLNFKRRSQAQKTETFIEGVSTGKSKRRKLVRPSFDEASSSAESTAKCLEMEGSFQELCGCDVTVLNEGNADAEHCEVPNRIDEDTASKDGSSQVTVIFQKSAATVKANESVTLESGDQLADGSVGSEGSRTASLIGEGQTSDQSKANTNGLSRVVNVIGETSPSQFDSQKGVNFKECSESNVSLSINEGNVSTTSLIGECQSSDQIKANTSGLFEVVNKIGDDSSRSQFDSCEDISFRESGESNLSLSINKCDEVNVCTSSLIGEGQPSDQSKGNTSRLFEVV